MRHLAPLLILLLIVLLIAGHFYNMWYVGNTEYIERYAQCLDHYQEVHPDWPMDEVREMCDELVSNGSNQ